MALAKIVGLLVAPVTPKPAISDASSPLSSSSRERVSSQIETPASRRARSGSMVSSRRKWSVLCWRPPARDPYADEPCARGGQAAGGDERLLRLLVTGRGPPTVEVSP